MNELRSLQKCVVVYLLLQRHRYLHNLFIFKYNELKIDLDPSPASEDWGEENKINWLYSHTRQLKDSNVIPAGIAGIRMPRMARLTSTSMCSGCRQSLPTRRFLWQLQHCVNAKLAPMGYIPPHPSLLPQGRRSGHLCRYLCSRGGRPG